MDWSDDVIARLRTLWAEGHSTAEIGRRLGVSKNAVVGKAHRLSLAARPSPIRRAAEGAVPKRAATKRVVGPTLPSMTPPAPAAAVPPPSPAPALRAVSRPAVARTSSRLVNCCWPIGEPGTKSFRFCDGDSLPGKPYCREHAALAYVRIRDRREDAA